MWCLIVSIPDFFPLSHFDSILELCRTLWIVHFWPYFILTSPRITRFNFVTFSGHTTLFKLLLESQCSFIFSLSNKLRLLPNREAFISKGFGVACLKLN